MVRSIQLNTKPEIEFSQGIVFRIVMINIQLWIALKHYGKRVGSKIKFLVIARKVIKSQLKEFGKHIFGIATHQ